MKHVNVHSVKHEVLCDGLARRESFGSDKGDCVMTSTTGVLSSVQKWRRSTGTGARLPAHIIVVSKKENTPGTLQFTSVKKLIRTKNDMRGKVVECSLKFWWLGVF